jgi:ATP-dependent DNA helicase
VGVLTFTHPPLLYTRQIFDDLDAFKSWFDIDVTSDTSASHQVVTKLHAILKPFLLRRIKREVEKSLPPKKEYLLSAPLTVQQKKLYDAVIKRQIRDFLLTSNNEKKKELQDGDTDDDEIMASLTNGKGKTTTSKAKGKSKGEGKTTPKTTPSKKNSTNKRKSEAIEDDNETSTTRSNKRTKGGPSSYLDDDSDDELWLEKLDDGTARDEAESFEERRFGKSRLNMVKDMLENEEDEDENSEGNIEKRATAKIKSLKLSNMVMQLRKVVNHVGRINLTTIRSMLQE